MAAAEDARKRIAEMKERIASLQKKKHSGSMGDVSSADGKPFGVALEQRKALRGHFGKVYALQWGVNDEAEHQMSGGSVKIVSASQDGKLVVWNGMTTNKLNAIPLRSPWVMTCAYEPTRGNMVACGGLNNLCSIYKLGNDAVSQPTVELAGHDGYLSCCRFVDDSTILTSSGDSACISWDIDRGEQTRSFNEHIADVMSLAISPTDKNIFVSGSCDTFAKVWDVRQDKAVMSFSGHESDINSVAFMPGGSTFVTGSDDSHCRLFDLRAYAQINIFKTSNYVSGITSVTVSKSGRLVFSGCEDHKCRVWDSLSSKNEPVAVIEGHEQRVSCVGVASSGDALCTGSWDSGLRIWA